MISRTVNQQDLSSECWMVQFHGLEYCNKCDYKDTKDCGGENIRKTGKNEKGKEVPI